MRILLISLCMIWAGSLNAANHCGELENDLEKAKCLHNSAQSSSEPLAEPTIGATGDLSQDVLDRLSLAQVAYLDYLIGSYDHRRTVFVWQLASSYILFTVVTLIVLIGLGMSWMQFRSAALAAANSKPGDKKEDSDTDQPIQFKFSLQGIEVNSSIIGVVILVISLAFFYLYLVHVYPIEELL